MKTKLLIVLTALISFVGTNAIAQQAKDDVNGDARVTVADVVSVIKKMKETGTLAPKHYWYIGQTNPMEMTEMSPIVTNYTSPGWRLIGTMIPEYSIDNMLWNGVNFELIFDQRDYLYLAIPYQSLQMTDSEGGDAMIFNTKLNNGEPVMINGVGYYCYKSDSKLRGFAFNIH